MQPSNPDFLATFRTWLELAYFVSGIAVAILAAFGLRQLQLAKQQLETSKEIFRTQSRRSAAEAAVVECRRFADTVIQDSLRLDKFIEDNSIAFFNKAKLERTEDGVKIDLSAVDQDDVKKLSGAHPQINGFLNGLEAHALYFLSGVADEEIAFKVNAKTYVEMAETAFKLFAITGVGKEDAGPIKALYFRWSRRLEAKQLKAEQVRLTRMLATFKDEPIPPIGA